MIDQLHRRLFGVSMGPKTIDFLKQLRWSMLGGVFTAITLFAVSVWAGRILGTDQYGQYSFAVATAQLIALFITWSFEIAIVRALAFTREDASSQQYIISSAILFLIITIVLVNLISYILPFPFLKGIVMAFATVLAIKQLFDGMMRGLGLFGYQAIGKVIEAVCIATAFAVLVYAGLLHSYVYYMIAVLFGGLMLLVWYATKIRLDASFRQISQSAFQVLWTYGSRAMIWLILSTVLGFAAKFIIREEFGNQFLGQFTVYSMVSISVMMFLGGLIANVFFPIAVEESNHEEMWRRMKLGTIIGAVPLFIAGVIITNGAVLLFGQSYYLSTWFGAGMALIAVIQFFTSMYWWAIASTGVSGIRYMAIHTSLGGLLFIGALSITVSHQPLWGIFGSYGLWSMYTIWAIWRWRGKAMN
ncbi:MAG: oligosaccharide flippase family protein [Candidatus Andersenbacteria bacterium]